MCENNQTVSPSERATVSDFYYVRTGKVEVGGESFSFLVGCSNEGEGALMYGMVAKGDLGTLVSEAMSSEDVEIDGHRQLALLVAAHLTLSDETFYHREYDAGAVLPNYIQQLHDESVGVVDQPFTAIVRALQPADHADFELDLAGLSHES